MDINVREAPPLLKFPVIDIGVVVTTLCSAVVDQNGVQVVRHIAVVGESVGYVTLELRNLGLYLLFLK